MNENGEAWFPILANAMGMPKTWLAEQLDVEVGQIEAWRGGEQLPDRVVEFMEQWQDLFIKEVNESIGGVLYSNGQLADIDDGGIDEIIMSPVDVVVENGATCTIQGVPVPERMAAAVYGQVVLRLRETDGVRSRVFWEN